MGRSPCCSKEGLNRGAWTSSEDQILVDYIKFHGEGKWRDLPKKAGLKRCGKSCRLRWLNYLRPDIKRGNISCDEEDLIIRLHKLLGNRWSLIAGRLPGRTDNEIKNYWNTCLRKKVRDQSNHTTNGKNPSETLRNKKPTKQNSGQFRSTPLFHTKALRCNKIFVSPQDHTQVVENIHLRTKVGKQALQLPIKSQEESPDFSTNFEIEELFVSDFLDTDFFGARENDLHGEKMIMNDNYIHLSPPNFSIFDEVMTDWINDQEQNHPGTDVKSFEKWLDV